MKRGEKVRNNVIGIRVTDEMLKRLNNIAKDMELTVSDIIRLALNDYLKKER